MASSIQPVGPAIPARTRQIHWGAWTRFFAPSFADCFFIALVIWLFACGASGWKSLLMDGDTGWHIRTGEYILAHHAVPVRDLFSFSKPDAPWFAWEWLTDVIYALLFSLGGLKAITLFSGALIATFATVLLRYTVWRGVNGLLAAFTTLLAVGSSTIHFLARPHLFTLLLLPVCLWLVEADRQKKSGWVWVLIPLTALWTNLHGGFLVFLVCLALLIAGSAVEAFLGQPRWPAVRRYSLLLIGCAAASLINPYGVGLHVHIFDYLRSDWIKNLVQEFQAPTFRGEGQLQFEAMLLVGLVCTGFLLRKQRITESFWILFLAYSALGSVRHAPLYVAVAAPLIALELNGFWKDWAGRSTPSSVVQILYQLGDDIRSSFRWTSMWPALLLLGLALMDAPKQWPQDFPSEAFPTALVHQNAAVLQSGRLFTTDQWGDYIIYSFYPGVKVFMDGRSDFYGESLGKEYLHLLQGSYDWRDILGRYHFQVALLPVEWPLSSMLKLDPAWKVVKDDGHAILFVRRDGQKAQAN